MGGGILPTGVWALDAGCGNRAHMLVNDTMQQSNDPQATSSSLVWIRVITGKSICVSRRYVWVILTKRRPRLNKCISTVSLPLSHCTTLRPTLSGPAGPSGKASGFAHTSQLTATVPLLCPKSSSSGAGSVDHLRQMSDCNR